MKGVSLDACIQSQQEASRRDYHVEEEILNEVLRKEIQRLRDELEQHQWVKCSERLPEDGCAVLVRCRSIPESTGYFAVGGYLEGRDVWTVEGELNEIVTHWKPITPPIEADTGEQK